MVSKNIIKSSFYIFEFIGIVDPFLDAKGKAENALMAKGAYDKIAGNKDDDE